jgi:hypothetical protein
MIVYRLYVAFTDNSSGGPSRKKRHSQTENHDEPYIDVKVFFPKKFEMNRKKKFFVESINA